MCILKFIENLFQILKMLKNSSQFSPFYLGDINNEQKEYQIFFEYAVYSRL